MYKIYTLTTVVIFSENVSIVLEGIGRGHHDRITHRKVLRYGSRQPLGAHSHSLQRHRLRHRQVMQFLQEYMKLHIMLSLSYVTAMRHEYEMPIAKMDGLL